MQQGLKVLVIVLICAGIFHNAIWAQAGQKKRPAALQQNSPPPQTDRQTWCDQLYKIVSPVIFNLAAGTLRKNMPIEQGKVPN